MPLKTLKIQETTHKELTKVKGSITSETGQDATYDDAIMGLIKSWRETKKDSKTV
jgi:hypothetical protein